MTRGAGLFQSFFQAGFECSTHRRSVDRRRLDMIAASGHGRFARSDYDAVRRLGLGTVRDGLRWHLIETRPGEYDWSSWIPMLRAAGDAGVEVIWDLFHYGWPDDIDIYSVEFIDRFAAFTRAAADVLREQDHARPFLCPVNEISFVSWAGGEATYINPFDSHRGFELKCQLVRASIAAMDAVRSVLPDARFVHCEPAIHIIADPARPQDADEAEHYRLFQFQSLDMLAGRLCPELGGHAQYLDIIGLNYYNNNQWRHNSSTIWLGEPCYRPFRDILREYHERYGCPMLIAETGCEGDERPRWFRYVCGEAAAAMDSGVPLHGICLYPVANHPGWDNERHCPNGLLGYAGEDGRRPVFRPLALELRRQQRIFGEALIDSPGVITHETGSDLFLSFAMGVRVPKAAASAEPLRARDASLLHGGADVS
ncbi:MAG TPA: hypothetical protein VFA04_03295 [Bryobacteraceae bacterium]|nr:hypothetical protein [Bryobacteraceae bacterium]